MIFFLNVQQQCISTIQKYCALTEHSIAYTLLTPSTCYFTQQSMAYMLLAIRYSTDRLKIPRSSRQINAIALKTKQNKNKNKNKLLFKLSVSGPDVCKNPRWIDRLPSMRWKLSHVSAACSKTVTFPVGLLPCVQAAALNVWHRPQQHQGSVAKYTSETRTHGGSQYPTFTVAIRFHAVKLCLCYAKQDVLWPSVKTAIAAHSYSANYVNIKHCMYTLQSRYTGVLPPSFIGGEQLTATNARFACRISKQETFAVEKHWML